MKIGRPVKIQPERFHIYVNPLLMDFIRSAAIANGRTVSGEIEWVMKNYYKSRVVRDDE